MWSINQTALYNEPTLTISPLINFSLRYIQRRNVNDYNIIRPPLIIVWDKQVKCRYIIVNIRRTKHKRWALQTYTNQSIEMRIQPCTVPYLHECFTWSRHNIIIRLLSKYAINNDILENLVVKHTVYMLMGKKSSKLGACKNWPRPSISGRHGGQVHVRAWITLIRDKLHMRLCKKPFWQQASGRFTTSQCLTTRTAWQPGSTVLMTTKYAIN